MKPKPSATFSNSFYSVRVTPLLLAIILHLIYLPDVFAARSLFVMEETRSGNLSFFPKWTGEMDRYSEQVGTPDSQCGKIKFYPCEVKEWKAFLQTLEHKPLRQQLEAVNDYINQHPYIIDQLNWGLNDYWATPFEMMDVDGADCEDYAISKFYSLRRLGVPGDQMRLMIVQDLNLGGIIHAVLGVYDGDDLLILDNQVTQVMPALKIYHYRPIYSVNENSWWAYQPK